jgi:deoxyribodipyrimidine photolyase-related protein
MEVVDLVGKLFSGNFGKLENFGFAVTRSDAIEVLDGFISDFLPNFGETQDAMSQHAPWLNHSLLSFYINIGSSMESKSAARQSGRISRGAHR